MRKSTKILLFFLLVLIAILFFITFRGKTVEKHYEIKDISYKTVYKDFSELHTLDTSYSYSTIFYTPNTRFHILNRNSSTAYLSTKIENIGQIYSDNRQACSMKVTGEDKSNIPKMLIENCAVDENGRFLDVVMTLSEYHNIVDDPNLTKNIELKISKDFYYETNQVHPLADYRPNATNLPPTTEKLSSAKLGSPIRFELNTNFAQAHLTVEYYYHRGNSEDEYSRTGSGTYIYDLGNWKRAANIKNINGYYSDVDVQTWYPNNRDTKDYYIFTGNEDKAKAKNEGINPKGYVNSNRDTSSVTIYYNKYNRDARFYRDYSSDVWKRPFLVEDNDGIRIDRHTHSSDTTYNEDQYYSFNINSEWYGNSIFMTKTGCNGIFDFYYSGVVCGIGFVYMSPVPYSVPNASKSQSVVKIDKSINDSRKSMITKGDTLIYNITQYVPNLYNTQNLNFAQVYGGEFGAVFKGFSISDQIDSNLDITRIRVLSGNIDVSSKFNISYVNNNVVATLKDSELANTDTYNVSYDLRIETRLKANANLQLKQINRMQYNIENTARRILKTEKTGTDGVKRVTETANTTQTLYMRIYYDLVGNVWIENGRLNGRKDSSDINTSGICVFLQRKVNNAYQNVAVTRTDQNGNYSFLSLPGEGIYRIIFGYNGQIFQATYSKNDYSGGYSVAREIESDRQNIQNKFAKISSYPGNYSDGRTYGVYQIIKDVDTNQAYVYNGYPLTFDKILVEYNNIPLNYRTYDQNFKNELVRIMSTKYGVSTNTANSIIQYLDNCMIASLTNDISINNINFENNNIDFGIYSRPLTDLSVTNDIYKVFYTVNGCTETHDYNKKSNVEDINHVYKINDADTGAKRVDSNVYNGNGFYSIDIKAANYLYDAQDLGENANRNLQMYVTYKYGIKNIGNTYTRINKLNNWVDNTNFIYDGDFCKAYLGDSNGNYIDNVGIINATTVLKGTYTNIQFSDIKNSSHENYLAPNEQIYIYVTYKVKNKDFQNGKTRLTIEEGNTLSASDDLAGKRNIIEIAEYETFYKAGKYTIPDYIDNNGNLQNKNYQDGMNLGTVDINSNPGSLSESDLDNNSDLIYNDGKFRIENDTDQAPNLKVKIDGNSIKISGTVFEDLRTETLSNGAVIGNGTLENEDTKINGVTIQIVEFVKEVDSNGVPTGNYTEEKIWNSYNYDSNMNVATSSNEYYSGIKTSKTLLSGQDEILKATPVTLGDGQYCIDGIPYGDFAIRFIYGDTERTVLTNDTNNEVNQLLNKKGMNKNSYNGQDYKSTIYQQTTSKVNKEYNGITNNYFNNNQINEDFYNSKNYINNYEDEKSYEENQSEYVKNSKDKLYFYDMQNISRNDSDAKDIYYYRQRCNDYARNLTNENAEILNSYNKLVLYKGTEEEKKSKQIDAINTLINNTEIKAQTGIINCQAVKNGETNEVNFGLVQRPISQAILSHDISNIRVTLANGEILFDTNKSTKNLYFSQHNGAEYEYTNNRLITRPSLGKNSKEAPEIIQMYIDEELIEGATLEAAYEIKVKNISEVDFNDNTFYYTGIENNSAENISTLRVNKIINYIPNNNGYIQTDENQNEIWNVQDLDELLNNENLVNKYYEDSLKTYNTIIITNKGENKSLKPELFTTIQSECSLNIGLKLSTNLGSKQYGTESLTYNDLVEIVDITTDNGRKQEYSIPGNQEMASQDTTDENTYNSYDVVTPKEIDADSTQKINILPPTGDNKNYMPIFISLIVSGIILIGSIVLIKLKIIK